MCNKHALGNTSWQTFIASRVEEPDYWQEICQSKATCVRLQGNTKKNQISTRSSAQIGSENKTGEENHV